MTERDFDRTSDFSPIAHRYDDTRSIPESILAACYARLARQGILPRQGTILDVGCGTGQISLPLAATGYAVRGYDIAPPMIALAQAKCEPKWPARYAVADARALPEADGSVEGIVFSKLLMHVEDWQAVCREMARILKPGCCLVHVIDRGAFGNAVRRQFSALADGLGFRDRSSDCSTPTPWRRS